MELLLVIAGLTIGPILMAAMAIAAGYRIGYYKGHRDGQIAACRLERFTTSPPGH